MKSIYRFLLVILSMLGGEAISETTKEGKISISKYQVDMFEGNQARYDIDFTEAKCEKTTVTLSFDGVPDGKVSLIIPRWLIDEEKKTHYLKEKKTEINVKNATTVTLNLIKINQKDDEPDDCEKFEKSDVASLSHHVVKKKTKEESDKKNIELEIDKPQKNEFYIRNEKDEENKTWVLVRFANDNTNSGIKSFKILHDTAKNTISNNVVAVAVHDDDDDIVCAALYILNASCFDIHIGFRGTMDNNGNLQQKPYYLVLARSRISDKWTGTFESEYYELPELEENEDNSTEDQPFEDKSSVYKITLSGKYDLGKDFSGVLAYGAKNSPDQNGGDAGVTPFYSVGFEHKSFFGTQKGVGLSGVAFVKDKYWENASDLTPEELADIDERIKIYGKVAINQKGSVMLTTYMDFNAHENGPSEVGVALTYGGKWSELLSSLGGIF